MENSKLFWVIWRSISVLLQSQPVNNFKKHLNNWLFYNTRICSISTICLDFYTLIKSVKSEKLGSFECSLFQILAYFAGGNKIY
ncbi:hypothetical protein EGR_06288 [Echinococcus granulosus]|uniref:Uncharacterized protein n=1 Tax=Echinococcus granulosus TaxID=6210 RepID=W6UZ41_ECHGR|nr:hypothetical protein EGR_06288 [Echinococcus granulosus]EUB58864.1 hypothetical protein EGR_06288 [Echinococcus granulosus]